MPQKSPCELNSLLEERILVLDGAMGTMLQQADLTPKDFGGAEREGCNENLVLTRPELVLDIHRKYYAAGADIVETNTFGGTPLVLGEYGLQEKAEQINKKAAALARKAANEFATPKKPRFVAGSMGPTTKAISVTGGITFRELVENFRVQAKGLIEGGVDFLLIETSQDTRNVKAATIGIREACAFLGKNLPVMISGTIEPTGTMLGGQAADAFVVSLSHLNLLALGLNCATGPERMTDSLRTLHELSPFPLSCYPNAGLPNEEGVYLTTPEMLARQLERFVDGGWLNIVGGCCGTTEKHIAAIAAMVEGKRPRRVIDRRRGRSFFSGIEVVESTADNRPLIVGERTNMIGSRLFKRLISENKWEEATEIARRQVKNGAHIVDVCLQGADRDELQDVDSFYALLVRKIKAPLMIDSTDPQVVERALTYCQGKSIINSINLEEGEKKFEKVCPLAKTYGAALVVGCIDEDKVQAQASTRERKLAIALRSYLLLTKKYGIPPENIIFDTLVFPCASGDENYIGSAVETIEGLRSVKEKFPECRTLLGISNVSFGLPEAAREVVNSVFLYHCTKAGLDLAIVNAEKLERFAAIPEEERKLAENLLFNRGKDSPDWRKQTREQRRTLHQENIARITEFYRGRGTARRAPAKTDKLPLDERLAQYIIQGTKDGLLTDLDLKRKEGARPLDIINGPLMKGMAEVGRLFNKNELIVAEVLQSAEAMKAAVSHLEPFMEKSETVSRGKVLLATVKGDVHDIGKNLVEIILKNNGYEVINLGIKVPPEELIRAVGEHKPDFIGLSGLLVKSAQQMVITAGDLKRTGIQVPLLVGGAALSDKFTRTKIAPSYNQLVFYAKDAMAGLDLCNKLRDEGARAALLAERKTPPIDAAGARRVVPLPLESTERCPHVRTDLPIPSVSSLDRHLLKNPPLPPIWDYLNLQMLYSKHLGFRGNFITKLAEKEPKALKLEKEVGKIKKEAKGFMKVAGVWQFFEAEGMGNDLHLFAPGGKNPLYTFHFPRQRKEEGLSLADYVLPPQTTQGKRLRDHVSLFVVGVEIRKEGEKAKVKGEYLKSYALQALALETAEGAAEWLHQKIRKEWGFPDSPTLAMADRLKAKYRGKRYSPGYPACPNLDDQQGIWKLLKPDEIGIHLTEGMMMEPESSVSAIVFHHPDCTYFSVGERIDA